MNEALKKPRRNSAMYCCSINCSNNGSTSIDPRTDFKVRMHTFPDPEKKKDLCQKWIVNLRRADLNLKNVKYKRVCSVHFAVTDYMCPSDIANSRLKPNTAPTLINCSNPLPLSTPSRPTPKDRSLTSPPPSKRKRVCSISSSSSNDIPDSLPDEPIFADQLDQATQTDVATHLDEKSEKMLAVAQGSLKQAKREIILLKRKVSRLQTRKKTLEAREKSLRQVSRADSMCEFVFPDFPPVPAALYKILLKNKRKITWESEKEAMEMSLSVYFRSPSAYKILRNSGFQLPHPSTLRRLYSIFMKTPGICPSLVEMLRLRCLTKEEREN